MSSYVLRAVAAYSIKPVSGPVATTGERERRRGSPSSIGVSQNAAEPGTFSSLLEAAKRINTPPSR